MLKFEAVLAKSIDQRRFQVRRPSRFFTKMVFAASPKTKYCGRKGRKTQNILIDGCYLLFEEYLQEKPVFIP